MSSTFESEQLRLALGADLGDEQVAAVALLLLSVSRTAASSTGSPFVFQAWKPPVIDDDVGVAHLPRASAPANSGAGAARAVDDDGRVAVGHGGLDLLLEVALAGRGGAGDVALVPLGLLADVDEAGAALAERSASAGLTSRMAARASRMRSA